MKTSVDERQFQIGQRRTGENAQVSFLEHMGLHEILKTQGERVHMTGTGKLDAASDRQWFHAQMDFRVVPQRFIMSTADDSVVQRFLIGHIRRREGNSDAKAVRQ